ncbi:MAG: gamma-glutamyl-gamma-aminobutyrate hydrolase family protein, partial [Candidatus Eremiobacteraeota bacterium]|nr:gamma-glutamyl-gamma-aminobutyrate hydrolase family protein [Candidatus Eremiobacteraeota bacterium]
NDATLLDAYLGEIDAVVVSGGGDVDPAIFGEPLGPKTRVGPPERDAFEIALVRAARERRLPALCICRGMQIANVAFGGSLIQDLPEHFGAHYPIDHQQLGRDGIERSDYAAGHTVYVDPNSALARLVGSISFASNSMHHQAVSRVAEDLRAVAWTSDGVIEALEARFSHPFFYCVQWHPEEFVGPQRRSDAIAERLFRGLNAAAAERRAVKK